MSKLSNRKVRRDSYYRRAKQQGYRARAVFKLEELDRRFSLIGRGARVLDLGCAPGSWLQYCRTRVGPGGVLVGIDQAPLREPIPGARVLVGDVLAGEVSERAAELLGDLVAFDVVLSDMAPATSGVRQLDQARSAELFERALDIAEATLAPGGALVAKLFQGPDFEELVRRCRQGFEAVKMAKPEGSRKASIEQYVVARGFRR